MIDLNDLAFRSSKSSTEWYKGKQGEYVEGSPFLEDSWSHGIMELKSDTALNNLEYRYNIYFKQMQIRTVNDTLILMHPEKVRALVFNNRKFVYQPYVLEELSGQDYFEILAEGKCNLLLRRDVSFMPKNPPVTPYSAGYIYDRFLLHENVYLQKAGSLAFFVKPTKKNVLKFLEDHQDELAAYAKIQNIKFNDNISLAKLISYYNSLN
ncbi:MAG: hypothetical protein WCO63_02030 [Bacteroidota bacterium]